MYNLANQCSKTMNMLRYLVKLRDYSYAVRFFLGEVQQLRSLSLQHQDC